MRRVTFFDMGRVSLKDTSLVNVCETTTGTHPDTLRAVNTFGQRLRTAREAHGYSQEQVGDAVGVTKATISKWELGKGEPSLFALTALRTLLHTSLDELVCGVATPATLVGNIHRVMDTDPEATRAYDIGRAKDSSELGVLIRFRAMSPRRRSALLEIMKPEKDG